jgi:Arc/MetJ-type ribon-helix-helix transcriptional regulator
MVLLTPELLAKMKHSVDIGIYKSRSEIVRAALTDFYYPKTEYSTSLPQLSASMIEPTSKLTIGKMVFDTTHQPGFIRRKLLKWLLGVTVV